MNKIIRIFLYVAVIVLLPQYSNPQLMLSIKSLFLILLTIFLLITQPGLKKSEKKNINKNDKNSMTLIFIMSFIGIIGSIWEWSIFSTNPIQFTTINYIGIIVSLVGITIRMYSFNYLGKYFSPIVTIKKEHQLVTNGIYKLIRHPTYLGAYLTMLGVVLVMSSILGILFIVIGLLLAYIYRINIEEKVLVNHFGDTYTNYKKNTYKMFPFVW